MTSLPHPDTLTELRDLTRAFARERAWEPFHTPKNLAMALSVEVAELAEHFQWLATGADAELDDAARTGIRHELADVLLYLVQLADKSGLADLRNEAALIKRSCERDTAQLAGTPSAERPDVFADTSPAEMLPSGVRTVLIHGEFDTVSPLRVGRDYARRAVEAGDEAEAIELPGGSHYDEVAASSPSWSIVAGQIRKALSTDVAPARYRTKPR